MEKTATITIKLVDSARGGSVTLFLNSSTDSFMYVSISTDFSIIPKELNPFPI